MSYTLQVNSQKKLEPVQVCYLEDLLILPLWYCHFELKPVWSLTPFKCCMLSGKSMDLSDLFPEILSHPSTVWILTCIPRELLRKISENAKFTPWSPSALEICGSYTAENRYLLVSFFSSTNFNVTNLPMDVASLWEHHAASAMHSSSPLLPLRQFHPQRWFQHPQCTRHLEEAASIFWCHTLALQSICISWKQMTSFNKF